MSEDEAAAAAALRAAPPLVAGREPSSESERVAECSQRAQAREAAAESLLTPLVGEHLVLATPAPPTVDSSSQATVEAATSESRAAAEEEEPWTRPAAPRRSPRALFGSFDGEEVEEEATPTSSHARDDERSERKRASPANALDDDLADASTLAARKKGKRSLASPPLLSSGAATAHRRGIFSPPDAPPRRPPFVRSMSSQSIFIGKTAATGKCAASTSSAAAATQLLPPSPTKAAAQSLVPQLTLPTTHSKSHPDLNVISPETVARLLRGDFAARLASYALVDCRFSYEFQGGSVRTARSLSDPASVERQFLWSPPADCARTALIFFCEFSANRAPKMLRHVRNLDRWIHAEQYPALFYPELYLIDGGYKNCFEATKEICEPPSYTPMSHSAFVPSCKREFALWRKHWKAHKTNACAAKLQQHHRLQKPSRTGGGADDDDASAAVDTPPSAPPVAMRSLSEML